MLRAYLDYSTARDEGITVHKDPDCAYYQRMDDTPSRLIKLAPENVVSAVNSFREERIRFDSDAEHGDMWVEADLGDDAEEIAAIETIRDNLGERYSPFAEAEIHVHCE